MKLFIYTLLDVGFIRILKRIIYKSRNFIDNLYYLKIKKLLFKKNIILNAKIISQWNNKLFIHNKYKKYKNRESIKDFVRFNLINEKKKFDLPLKWNNNNWQRLWQFHLHYFNWLRNWIENDIKGKRNNIDLFTIEVLINDWIDKNDKSSFDGWHSYTISLRIRNWIIFFSIYKNLLKEKILISIWDQLIWLDNHNESYLGGNHFIENLTSLIFGSLFFSNNRSEQIFSRALKKLEREIKNQILNDGGHEERSASYHVLLLDRLVEISCLIYIFKGIEFKWLTSAIQKMYIWVLKVRSEYKIMPRFNDNLFQNESEVDNIIQFSKSFLEKSNYCKKGIRSEIIKECKFKKVNKSRKFKELKNNSKIIDLPNTGWIILKPSNNIYLAFKYGQSCPKHLPGHAHSDSLSFDLYYKDNPIFAEVGTSTYEKGERRFYERSLAAHNGLQLGSIKSKTNPIIKWIEPVEVWDSFKAGRKTKEKFKKYGKDKNGSLWVEASHDAFKKINADHIRRILIKKNKINQFNLIITDYLEIKNLLAIRSWWHLGPSQDQSILFPLIDYYNQFEINHKWINTYMANCFNRRIHRKTLLFEGIISPGAYKFVMDINLNLFDNPKKYKIRNKDVIY